MPTFILDKDSLEALLQSMYFTIYASFKAEYKAIYVVKY
jgi:hypothetical protein